MSDRLKTDPHGLLVVLASLVLTLFTSSLAKGESDPTGPTLENVGTVVLKLSPGSWVGTARVIVTVAADGSTLVTIDTTSPVTILGISGDTPLPPPPPPPPPPPLDKIGKHKAAVKSATVAVVDPNKVNTQAALSKLYTTIADLPVTDRGQLAQATDIMFNALNLPPSWHTWKTATDKSLDQFTDLPSSKEAWKATGQVLGGVQ